MPGIQDPNMGMWYSYDDDESGWGDQVSSNFLKIGTLMQISVISRTLTAPPGSPANGDTYIPATGATGAWAGKANQIAVWRADQTAWEFYVPKDGWLAGVVAEGIAYIYVSGSWVAAMSGPLDADLVAIAALSGTGVPRRTGTNTWDLVTLGTAATANLTTTPLDRTTGSVLKVFDFGMGADSAQLVSDANTITYTSIQRTTNATTNIPVATNGVLFTKGGFASTYASQIFITAAGVKYFRSMNGGTWGSWRTVWDSVTLVKTATTTDVTVGNMLKVGDHGVTGVPLLYTTYGANLAAIFATSVTFNDAAAVSDSPAPADTSAAVHHTLRRSAARGVQHHYFLSGTNAGAYRRMQDGASYGSWVKYWDTGNTSPNVQTMLAAADNAAIRTAIGAAYTETGTFTPTVVGTSTAGTGTYSVQTGRYTRLGNQVVFTVRLAWSAHTGTGNIQINGLPLTSGANNRATCAVQFDGLTVGAGKQLSAFIGTSASSVAINACDVAGGALAAVALDTDVTELVITGSYEI